MRCPVVLFVLIMVGRWRPFVAICSVLFLLNLLILYHRLVSRSFEEGDVILDVVERYSFKLKDAYSNEDDEELAFEKLPSCNLTSSIVLKVLKRVQTDQCREKIHKIGCLMKNGSRQLHPIKLPRQCPLSNPMSAGYWMGCFKDNSQNRLLKSGFYKLTDKNSPEECISYCLRAGQEIAGLEYKDECFCGSKSDLSIGQSIDDKDCDKFVCPGDHKETCGGVYALSAYKTGIGKILEFQPELVDFKSGEDQKLNVGPKVKIAFLLQLNGRSFRQVIRLLKLIYRPEHFYYVHVDSRQDFMYKKMLEIETQTPGNLRVKRRRFSTIWGGSSLLGMVLDGAKDLMTSFEESKSFDYLINYSESDMPLLDVDELTLYLTKHNGTSFIKGQPINRTAEMIRKQGLNRVFFQCEERMWMLGDRRMPDDIVLDGGSDWFVLHRSLVEYAATSQDKLVVGLKQMYKFALLPVESFFHTLAANSIFCLKTARKLNLKWTNWQRKRGCKCQQRSVVDWCGCSPNTFTSATELQLGDDLVAFRNYVRRRFVFSARKFDPLVSQTVINRLDHAVRKSNPKFSDVSLFPSFESYWQTEFDSNYDSQNSELIHKFGFWLDSMARISIDRFICTNALCKPPKNLNYTLHSYRQHDKLVGLLLNFKIQCGNDVIKSAQQFDVEFLIKRQSGTVLHVDNHRLAKFLINLEVGSNFDVKEEIFRNDAGFNVVKSLLYAKLTLKASAHIQRSKIRYVWMNPRSEAISSNVLKIGHSGVEYFNLSSNRNEFVGTWTLKLQEVENFTVLAETKFLVLPEFSSTNSLGFDVAEFRTFYNAEDACLVDSENFDQSAVELDEILCPNFLTAKIQRCSTRGWSSKFPDPKSEIHSVDQITGFLLP